MALTKKQLEDVCLINEGYKQCRYLDEEDDNGKIVQVCKKLTPDAVIIDEEIDEFMIDMQKNKQDPSTQNLPIQVNCNGYLKLKSKKQGYDVK
jgi:type II secretory pathway component PulC